MHFFSTPHLLFPLFHQMAELVYSSLPTPTSIRLLTILPGDWKRTIRCFLNVVDPKFAPAYEALFYVWRPPSLGTKIICNNIEVCVTENLYAALRQIRTGRARNYEDVTIPEGWESTPPKEWSKLSRPTKQKTILVHCFYGLTPCASINMTSQSDHNRSA
jgi:hypothetical protein